MKPDPPTDLDRWRQIEPILDQALELAGEERGSLLAVVCADDPVLQAEVEALLAADAAAGGFLGLPVCEYAPELLAEATGEEENDADLSDLAGCQVGPYRLLREIGSGGMGTVYEAEDTRLGRRVAVKVLPPELSRNRQAKERFLREARAASTVDHPNLCTVHDVGESDGRLYIVLSLYEGETLRERIRRGALPPAGAREVAIQIARGLARAHEAGITHRDLKPANVMLTCHGEVKILDFGIARLEGDEATLTRTGATLGTPAYMSPEQARGDPVDRRTDIWSLGVLLYEMVAGRRPFGGEGVQAVVAAILTQEPEPLARVCPEAPPELARVAARALAKDPAERYPSATELLADLESGPLPAHEGRKSMLRMALLVGALVALALVGFALFWRLWPIHVRAPLRVAVLRPKLTLAGDNPELASVAPIVMEATLGTLLSLEGVQPLDPPDKDEEGGSKVERLRSAEADEVLLPVLDCRGNSCRLALRRLRKPGGAIFATVGPFEVEAGIENAQQVAEEVQVQLQQLYPAHRPRPGSPSSRVRPQDYSTYIELERRVDRGERLGAAELARLDALLKTSPDLLGAWLLTAGTAYLQGDLDRALADTARAQELAPYDPRPLLIRLRAQLEGNRFDAAHTTLAQLTHLAPGDARVKSAEADLLEAQGELEDARHVRQEVAQRRPTWRHILELATVESRLGESDSARRRLSDLLASQPDNQYVRQNLAMLEAGSGDLKRAAALYEALIQLRPTRPVLNSLGFVRFLLGNYASAAEAYRRALTLEPGHLLTRFNLATALEAQGDLAGAHILYRTLAKELAAAPQPLEPRTRMLHAQCLVRLGQKVEAERLADEVLKKRPEDVQVLHQAAQLYALLGERLPALYYTDLALKKGLRREWFTIPEFRSLQEDPDFRALLRGRAPIKASG